MATVPATNAISAAAATCVSSGVTRSASQKEEDAKVFDYSSADQELVKISKETGEVGPTINNAKKLSENRAASNPFQQVTYNQMGSRDGANIYNNLENIDWSTGQFLNLTLG